MDHDALMRIDYVAVLRCCTAQLGYPSADACAGDSSCASTRDCIPTVSVGITAKTVLVALLSLGVARPAVAARFPAGRNGRATRYERVRCMTVADDWCGLTLGYARQSGAGDGR
jgi:hypothetical protein